LSVWPIWSGRFGLSRFNLAVSVTGLFCLGRFGLEKIRSDYEILQKSYMFTFYANLLKLTKGFILKKTTNMIQDPTVDQHQHMIVIIISKQSKSSTFCN